MNEHTRCMWEIESLQEQLRAAEKQAADAERERDEARADHAGAERDARTLDAMLKNEQAALQEANSALSASQAQVQKMKAALEKYGQALTAAAEQPGPERELTTTDGGGVSPHDALNVGYSIAIMAWLRAHKAALADSPAPPPKTLLTQQEVRDRFNAVLDKEPLPRPPLPEGAEPDSPNFKPKELEELEARGFKRINNPRPCAVCRTKAAGLPTPGYIHDAGCPEESK